MRLEFGIAGAHIPGWSHGRRRRGRIVLAGVERFLVEIVRRNDDVALGLTQAARVEYATVTREAPELAERSLDVLAAAVASVYKRGAYASQIDYSQLPPLPSLSDAETAWLDTLLHHTG